MQSDAIFSGFPSAWRDYLGETILQFREVTTDLEDAFLHVAGESNQDTDADSDKSETVGEEAGE